MTTARHEEMAERIITFEGMIFALAVTAGKDGELREARGYLKAAICRALAEAAQTSAEHATQSPPSSAQRE